MITSPRLNNPRQSLFGCFCKFHIFSRRHNKGSSACKMFFANNLYFPYTHPRHLLPLNAVFRYRFHTQLTYSTNNPFQAHPHRRADWSGNWKHPESCMGCTATAPVCVSHVHTRWQDWSLDAAVCHSATEDLDNLQGSCRSKLDWGSKMSQQLAFSSSLLTWSHSL